MGPQQWGGCLWGWAVCSSRAKHWSRSEDAQDERRQKRRRGGIQGSLMVGREKFLCLVISPTSRGWEEQLFYSIFPDAGPKGTQMDCLPVNTARWEETLRFRNSFKISWAASAGKSSASWGMERQLGPCRLQRGRSQLQGKTVVAWPVVWKTRDKGKQAGAWSPPTRLCLELLCNSREIPSACPACHSRQSRTQTFSLRQFLSIENIIYCICTSSLIHRTQNFTSEHSLRFFCLHFDLAFWGKL